MSFLSPRRPQGSSGAISAVVTPTAPRGGPHITVAPHGGPHGGLWGPPWGTPSALVFFLAREGVEPDAVF